MSKMTVGDENEHGPIKYWHLEFVEFLEFIGRLAWLLHQDTPKHKSWTMVQKIEVVLDDLMAYIGTTKEDPTALDQ